MHILVTNDDGPPSPDSSPYVRCLVEHLRQAGHVVSVCLPHTQRSWIGKAHMIGQTLKPLYYQPSANLHGEDTEGSTHRLPSTASDADEWILIDGTPASCVQIGLYHLFKHKGPIDLVVSGPNYGRNTSSVFALSSGTLGAALEAAICRRKSIALSFAFFSRNHEPVIIEAACRHSVRVIDALYRQWPTDGSVDLYSVNVPLVEGVEHNKSLWTDVLQNYWRDGSCFQEIDPGPSDACEEEALIREGVRGELGGKEESEGGATARKHKVFKWAPRLADVYDSVDKSEPGNDGRTVREGNTSITPLKANFALGEGALSRRELELADSPRAIGDASRPCLDEAKQRTKPVDRVKALVAYDDTYLQPLIVSALQSLWPQKEGLELITEMPDSATGAGGVVSLSNLLGSGEERVLQMTPYEAIDFEFAASHPQTCLINSYMIRKALIRKHFLSATVDHWLAKRPMSLLAGHVKGSEAFEVDYAEFLDDALVEAFDLRKSMEENAARAAADREWWILKPGMSDGGQGIRLFSTMDELQAIFDGWEADESDDESDVGEDDAEGVEDGLGRRREREKTGDDRMMTSHLRHFVAQPYIAAPLLLDSDRRKFHVRVYVLCSGRLSVYVYRPMLALFAAKAYAAPWGHQASDSGTFLTNSCLDKGKTGSSAGGGPSVRAFWRLPLPDRMLESIFEQICGLTGELLEAAATAMPVHFQTLPNAFEVFGLDFLVDEGGTAWLLEANAFPDFKQTGEELKEIVAGFWREVVRTAVLPFFGMQEAKEAPDGDGQLVAVRKLNLGAW